MNFGASIYPDWVNSLNTILKWFDEGKDAEMTLEKWVSLCGVKGQRGNPPVLEAAVSCNFIPLLTPVK